VKNIIIHFFLIIILYSAITHAELTNEIPIHDTAIEPGDRLEITSPYFPNNEFSNSNTFIFGDNKICVYTVQVDYNGIISLPIIGKINTEGQTTKKLNSIISDELYRKTKKKIIVEVNKNFYNSHYAYIWGNIKNPGKYYFDVPFNLYDLIAKSGGFYQGFIKISIYRNDTRRVITANIIEDTFYNSYKNIPLEFGDIVHLESIDNQIFIGGEFRKQGAYEIRKKHISLAQAIALGGGLSEKADLSNIMLIRESGEMIHLNLTDPQIYEKNEIKIYLGDTLLANRRFWPTYEEMVPFILFAQLIVTYIK